MTGGQDRSSQLILSYQACNDRLCQAPARLGVPLTVTIGK